MGGRGERRITRNTCHAYLSHIGSSSASLCTMVIMAHKEVVFEGRFVPVEEEEEEELVVVVEEEDKEEGAVFAVSDCLLLAGHRDARVARGCSDGRKLLRVAQRSVQSRIAIAIFGSIG